MTDHTRRFLFVGGVPRSGTSALTRVLNSHTQVGMCMERFKYLMHKDRIEEFVPELFEEARLFDFDDGLTNIRPENSDAQRRYYDRLRERLPILRYIGDKVPGSFRHAKSIRARFPGARYVFIFRDIAEIAASWNARAARAEDRWPTHKTGDRAVESWNAQSRIFIEMKHAYPEDFHAVRYEQFFGGNPEDLSELQRLLRFLELDPDGRMEQKFVESRQHYHEKLAGKVVSLDERTHESIAQQADYNLYHRAIDIGDTSRKAA